MRINSFQTNSTTPLRLTSFKFIVLRSLLVNVINFHLALSSVRKKNIVAFHPVLHKTNHGRHEIFPCGQIRKRLHMKTSIWKLKGSNQLEGLRMLKKNSLSLKIWNTYKYMESNVNSPLVNGQRLRNKKSYFQHSFLNAEK